jgi:transaldolase/glucose-6-phosphate isomerase
VLEPLAGQVAIADAKLAYQRYWAITASPRWETLAARGAQPQRLLWASTGAKNPAHRDVRSVEELVGPETVNTVPPTTLDAARDHGVIRPSLEEDVDGARRTLVALEAAGISLDTLTADLLTDAVRLFAEPFQKLLGVVAISSARCSPTSSTASPIPGREVFDAIGYDRPWGAWAPTRRRA